MPSQSNPPATPAPAAGATNPGDESPAGTPGTADNSCPACGGSGRQGGGAACTTCGGSGTIVANVGDA